MGAMHRTAIGVLAAILATACPAAANLLNYSGFEGNYSGNYLGPYVSTGFPVAVGSPVWDGEVVGQWVPCCAHAGWRASDGDGGTAVNLRKQNHSYCQAISSANLPANMPLELSFRYQFLTGAVDTATLYVRVIAMKTAGAGQADTTANPHDPSSIAAVMTGAAGNYVQLGAVAVPVAAAPRDVWTTASTTVLYEGGWDYILVMFGYKGAANANYYLVDDVELNEPALVANAGPDVSVLDADNDGFETITLDGSLSTSLTGAVTSYTWTENGDTIATGPVAAVDFPVGTHAVTLTVTDSTGAEESDEVLVEVIYGGPRPPVAEAGPALIRAADIDGNGFEAVSLDGTASSDPDGTIVSWAWSEGATALATGATADVTLSVGLHEITLTVTDDTGLGDTDTVTVNVRAVPALLGNAISEFKSGISLDVQGVYGLDYLVENWYHDPAVDPRCTIYIRSHVPLAMTHNAMNLLAATVVGADGGGTIRYRPDMDMTAMYAFTEGNGTPYPAWVDGTSFDTMRYPDGAAVLNATGPLPGALMSVPTGFYWRGLVDAAGDQWHTLSVWDDDYDPDTYYDTWCSDGRMHYFVVNPATPCVSLAKASADAQWYTTPIKAYFVPKFREQTTYLQGDVLIELAALEAAPVRYSLREEGSAEDFWQDYTGPLSTVDLALAADTRYELRCRIGDDGAIRTRILHYDPAYPSDAEEHPHSILWQGSEGLQRIRDRINDPASERALYRNLYDEILTNSWLHRRGRDTLMNGDRRNTLRGALLHNAFPLLIEGFDSHPDAAAMLRDGLLDNILNLDPIGREGNHNNALPCKELNYQGYYSVATPLYMALAYDWVIKDMRAGVHPSGFTAVEDYKMRDMLAHFAVNTSARYSSTYTGWIDPNGYDVGMWSTAWLVGANIIAAVMPEYNSELFGSSGAPGGSSGPAAPWTPFPNHPATWWDVAADRGITLYSYPDQTVRSGYWGLLNEVPVWNDRGGYFASHLMGYLYFLNSNFRANYDGYHFPHFEEAFVLAADAALPVTKSPEEGPAKNISALMINHNFPALAAKFEPMLLAGVPYSESSLSESVTRHYVLGLCLYEDDWRDLVARPGDADGDGDVDLDDFVILKRNFGTPSGATRAMGDFDGDGDVDLDDFVLLKTNFGSTAGAR
ncbi:MAG: hypothetical protein GX591_12655 [Planctomycetes bacterium]|nr:hypothetical protein [Planctomycetota bacterium]